MDLWVVAAAAGAGYLAKNWQNFLRDKEGSSGFASGRFYPDEPESPSLFQRIRDKTCPISKLKRTKTEKGDHSGEVFAETTRRDGLEATEATCTGALSHEKGVERFEDGNGLDADMGDVPEHHTWEMGASHGSTRSKSSLRSRRLRLQYIKPRSSLDSCLMAQMHREHAEMEEYLLTPLSSPCTPSLRPFLVTDGRRVISKAIGETRARLYHEVHSKAENEVVGVPRLPHINTANYSRQKFNRGKNHMQISRSTSKLTQIDTSDGSSSGQVLFCFGISIGIMSTIIANKLELEKLKKRLKQSENLVEDLQEELEMKDSLTVKELNNDDDSQDIHESSSCNGKMNMFFNQADTNVLIRYADEESVSLKKDESISKIEAELEAELERLELSMKGSAFPGRLSDALELDQEFDQDIIAELVHGELQADIVRGKSSSEPTPDRGSHSTRTPHSMKDGVAPHELTLRLHEVIQSRLEERILDLEAELAKSQKKIQHLESERRNCSREASNSGSSSSRCSPRTMQALGPMAQQPLVMNLSGDALDAYYEAFEELNKINASENNPSQLQDDSQQGNLSSSNDGMDNAQSGSYSTKTVLAINREETSPVSITRILSSEASPSDYHSKDYDDDDDDDELLLIKQIVEKARQGSPAILRAQRAMVSLATYDH